VELSSALCTIHHQYNFVQKAATEERKKGRKIKTKTKPKKAHVLLSVSTRCDERGKGAGEQTIKEEGKKKKKENSPLDDDDE